MRLSALLQRVETSVSDVLACEALAAELTTLGKLLAADGNLRLAAVAEDLSQPLTSAWSAVSDNFGSNDQPTGEEAVVDPSSAALLALAVAFARLTRNLLIDNLQAKEQVLSCEPHIRSLAYQVTTFDKIKGPRYLALQRAIYQALANLFVPVTGGETEGLQELCKLYFGGKQREDDIVSRALDSDDISINHAVLLLIRSANRISPANISSLTSSAAGKISSRLLDKLANQWFDGDARCFDAGALVFDAIIEAGKTAELYETLSTDEPISPSQATLLKLLDAHLQASKPAPRLEFLIPAFLELVAYGRRSMGILDGKATSRDDPLLPRVFEGLILVSQSLHASALAEQAGDDGHDLLGRLKQGTSVESLVGLLQDLDVFIPRVKPFRPAAPNAPAATTSSSTSEPDANPFRPFATLKRDVVQLIGVMAFEDRAVQDRVRLCGGVETILSLCVADDANPYIREHALFATRHLLLGNPENQAIIGKMDPLGIVDEATGELRELPERMGVKRQQQQP